MLTIKVYYATEENGYEIFNFGEYETLGEAIAAVNAEIENADEVEELEEDKYWRYQNEDSFIEYIFIDCIGEIDYNDFANDMEIERKTMEWC